MTTRFVCDDVDVDSDIDDSDSVKEPDDKELLYLERQHSETSGYDPDDGFIVNDPSDVENPPKKTRNLFEKHIIRLLETAYGRVNMDNETEAIVFQYARKYLQLKIQSPPPPSSVQKRARLRKRRVLSSSEESE